MSYRRSKRKKREKGLIWVFAVVALLAAFLLYQTSVLKKRQAVYAAREQDLEEQIAAESRRAEELEEYEEAATVNSAQPKGNDQLSLGFDEFDE